MRLYLLIASITALFAAGCGSDSTCSESSDCFSGEVCIEGACVAATNNVTSPNGGTNNTTPNGGTNNPNPDGGTNNPNPDGGTNNTTPDGGSNNTTPDGTTCEVDPFTATCEEDPFEVTSAGPDNDEFQDESLPLEPSRWCAGGTLNGDATFSAVLCNSDPFDHYRILIDNRGPICIDSPVTVTIEVIIEQTCNPDRIEVEPYTFFDNPNFNDLCADDDSVRCTSFDDGQRRVIEWRRDPEQMIDLNLRVGAADDNVQFDYTVNVTVQ